MDHKVEDVKKLYEDSTDLYNNVVVKNEASAENMLSDLDAAIKNLKENWKGIDAGGKIQEVINVHNSLVRVRNDLAHLASDSSGVASYYRDIQIANDAHLERLEPLTVSDKTNLDSYTDTEDRIDINEAAETGRDLIDNVRSVFDSFVGKVQEEYQEIMNNWTVGTGRDRANDSFNNFLDNAEAYKTTLRNVSDSITTALKNYKA